MNVLSTMAAIALTLGISGGADVWELPTVGDGWSPSAVTVEQADPVTTDAACVLIPVYDMDGFLYTDYVDWTRTGDWTGKTLQASIVGTYLNIAFDQPTLASWDMELTSIDVTGLSEVLICR